MHQIVETSLFFLNCDTDLHVWLARSKGTAPRIKKRKLVAYSIFEQLTNPIQSLQQRTSAVAHLFVGKKIFRKWRKWVKSGCKKTTARNCSL
jgi:hypothetical protein